jgi:hypothetical protein
MEGDPRLISKRDRRNGGGRHEQHMNSMNQRSGGDNGLLRSPGGRERQSGRAFRRLRNNGMFLHHQPVDDA